MSILQCFAEGFKRVRRAPAVIFWIYFAIVLLTFPLTGAMREILKSSIGSSLIHETLQRGFDLDWYGEFESRASGLAGTFGPRVVGILAVLDNFERLMNGEILEMNWSVLLPGVLFLLTWVFFGGGIISRYSSPERPLSRSDFFGTSASYFFRFLQLLIISVLAYKAVFRWIADPLHKWVERATLDVTAERTVMLYSMSVYLFVGLLMILISMVLDYAKIAIVIEARRNVLLALFRGMKFVGQNPLRTLGLYLLLVAAGLILVLGYALIAPGPSQSNMFTVLVALAGTQAFLLARIVLKLWFLAGQTTMFQDLAGSREQLAATHPVGPAGVPGPLDIAPGIQAPNLHADFQKIEALAPSRLALQRNIHDR